MSHYDVLIVGAGQAGAQAAVMLRQLGFAGSLAMIGAEPHAPYSRPPLSKEYLSGKQGSAQMLLRPPGYWEGHNVELHTGLRVDEVRARDHAVMLEDGRSIGYGQLIWATGGSARRLPGLKNDLAGVHTIRTRDDVDRLRDDLETAAKVVIIGGGYVGLEAAASLVEKGKQVTLVESRDRLLGRVTGKTIARFFEAEHMRRGVDVRLGTTIEGVDATAGRVSGVFLADGERIAADLLVVGIGIAPAVEPLLAAGAQGGNGVRVDPLCRTTLPDIYAIGDCALHANCYAGGAPIRLESVQNANDMAATAARSIVGAPVPYEALPWFWSNQYGIRMQTAGICGSYEQEIVRGDPNGLSFSVGYLRGGRLMAMDCINAPRDFVQAKTLIARGGEIQPDALADASTPLVDKTHSQP